MDTLMNPLNLPADTLAALVCLKGLKPFARWEEYERWMQGRQRWISNYILPSSDGARSYAFALEDCVKRGLAKKDSAGRIQINDIGRKALVVEG